MPSGARRGQAESPRCRVAHARSLAPRGCGSVARMLQARRAGNAPEGLSTGILGATCETLHRESQIHLRGDRHEAHRLLILRSLVGLALLAGPLWRGRAAAVDRA